MPIDFYKNKNPYSKPAENTIGKYSLAAGGVSESWKKIYQEKKPIFSNVKPNYGIMERVPNYVNNPIVIQPNYNVGLRNTYGVLDYKKLTFEDIKNHALQKQDLAESTVKARMKLLAKMETHAVYPIDFNKPDWKQFFRYMDHIKIHGETNCYGKLNPVGIHGLKNRRNAWYMYAVAIGCEDIFPKYPIPKRKIPDNSNDVPIPTPETVYAMLNNKYVKNRDLNRYIQYLFWFGFFIGAAPEKEWILLNVDDVVIDTYGNNFITIKRPKVGNKSRKLRIEKTIATSPVHKSFYNYLTYIRPKFALKSTKALFPDPKTKKRWSNCDKLRHLLTKHGKSVYRPFYPYLMRHWCGTARMLEWDKKGNSFMRVNYWLGHKKTEMTKRYCRFAELFSDDKGSWLSRSLKQKRSGGLVGKTKNAQESAINGAVVQNTLSNTCDTRQVRDFFLLELKK